MSTELHSHSQCRFLFVNQVTASVKRSGSGDAIAYDCFRAQLTPRKIRRDLNNMKSDEIVFSQSVGTKNLPDASEYQGPPKGCKRQCNRMLV